MSEAYWISAGELARRGAEDIPEQLLSSRHLVYSSPATLAFNSPGAQGFGVKRAGLAVPESVMLLVAPGCCGRNTTALGHEAALAERFYYLLQDDTDIVTGRHLSKITDAVVEICKSRSVPPSAVMLCITCVDALLGTDMDRVCRNASQAAGVPVVPCYMYALTREGRLPPMTQVRDAVYSLLPQERPRDPRCVNLLGYFSPLDDNSDLFQILRSLGLRRINQLSRCSTFSQYEEMGEANFNLVLHHEARYAAGKMEERLKMPSIEISRFYHPEKIARQYQLLATALGNPTAVESAVAQGLEECQNTIKNFREKFGAITFAVGEWSNANPFELALALAQNGFSVTELFGTVGEASFPFIRRLAELQPECRIYSNLSPSMLFYDGKAAKAQVAIGRDAAYYHPGMPAVHWADELQPFGFTAVKELFRQLTEVLQ